MNFYSKQNAWADSTIKSILSVLERPRYKFKVNIFPARAGEDFRFLITTNDEIAFILSFVIHKNHHSMKSLEARFTTEERVLNFDPLTYHGVDKFLNKQTSFVKGHQKKSRQWAVFVANLAFENVNLINTARVING